MGSASTLVILFAGLVATTVAADCPTAWPVYHVQSYGARRLDNMNHLGHPLYELDVEEYEDLDTATVSLRSFGQSKSIRGFIAVAEPTNTSLCGLGQFEGGPADLHKKQSPECPHVLLNADGQEREEVTFPWKRPSCGCIKIRATIMPSMDAFYTDDDWEEIGPLTKTVCVEKEAEEETTEEEKIPEEPIDDDEVTDITDPITDVLPEGDEEEAEEESDVGEVTVSPIDEDTDGGDREKNEMAPGRKFRKKMWKRKQHKKKQWRKKHGGRMAKKHAKMAKKMHKLSNKAGRPHGMKRKWAAMKMIKKKMMMKKKWKMQKKNSKSQKAVCNRIKSVTKPPKGWHKKWSAKVPEEEKRTALWRQRVEQIQRCCQYENEDEKQSCMDGLKRQKIDAFCANETSFRVGRRVQKKHPNYVEIIRKMCCKTEEKARYDCFNRSSDSFWKKQSRKSHRAVKKENMLCRRHSRPSPKFMKAWRAAVPSWKERMALWREKRRPVSLCCQMEGTNRTTCFEELRKARAREFCYGNETILPVKPEAAEDIRAKCCNLEDEERMECLADAKRQMKKSMRKSRRHSRRTWHKKGKHHHQHHHHGHGRTEEPLVAKTTTAPGENKKPDVLNKWASCCKAATGQATNLKRGKQKRSCVIAAKMFVKSKPRQAKRPCFRAFFNCCFKSKQTRKAI